MESRSLDPQSPANPASFDARALGAYSRINAAISAIDDLDRLGQEFAVIAADLLGDLCSIQVLNQHNELIHLAGLYDPDPRALSLLQDAVTAMAEMPRDQGVAGQVIRSGEPMLLERVPEEALRAVLVPEFVRYVDEVGMSSALAIPLKGRNGSIGAITMGRHRGHASFTESDLEFLTALAQPMASGLENLIVVQSLRRQLVEASQPPTLPAAPQFGADARARLPFDRLIEAVNDFGDQLEPLCQQFAVICSETFGDLASIAILNQDGEMIHIAGLYDTDPYALSMIRRMVAANADQPRDQGFAATVMRTGEPLLVASVPPTAVASMTDPATIDYFREIGVETIMAVPLRGRTGILGEISLTRHRGAQPYTQSDLNLLCEMAGRMSLVIDNLLVVEALRAQIDQFTASRVYSAIETAPTEPVDVVRARQAFDRLMKAAADRDQTVDELARQIAVIVAESIGDLCTIVLANPHNDLLHIAGRYDVEPAAQALLEQVAAPKTFMLSDQSTIAPALRTGRPILRQTITDEEMRPLLSAEYIPYFEQFGFSSLMTAPLLGRIGTLGAIALYRHRGSAPYSEADFQFLTDLALRISIVLENILLAESLREQASSAPVASTHSAPIAELGDAGRLAVLHRLTHLIGENRDRPDRMTELASVLASESLGGSVTLYLLNRGNQLIDVAAYYDPDPRARYLMGQLIRATAQAQRDRGMIGQVVQTGEPLFMPVVDESQLSTGDIPAVTRYIEEVGVASLVVVPLRGTRGVVGAISISRHRGAEPFTEADRGFLSEIAFRIAIAVENQQLVESLRREVAATSGAQLAFHASEERFRSVFDSSALAIEIMDAAAVLIDVNSAFEAMTGFTRADMLGRPYGTLQHPDDVRSFLSMLTELKMNRMPPGPVENRIICRDGSVIWVRTHLAPVKKRDDGAISYMVAMHENITGRKHAEQYFQAVLESTPDALVMVDSGGRIMLVNRQMEQMFGYDRQDILGREVELLVPERLRDRHPFHRDTYLNQPHVRPMGEDLELFVVAKDGREIPVEISLSPLQTDANVVVVAAIRDISERKQRQLALMRSERSLAEAQSIAHLGSLEFDIATQRLEASDEALRIFGLTRDDPIDSPAIQERMHPADRHFVVDSTQAVIAGSGPQEIEFRVVLPDGTIRIVHDRVALFTDAEGRPARVLGTVQDVTEQRRVEREMAELKSHLQSSAELERLRLAQDLHDGPMQELYGASYRLDELRDAASPELASALDEVNGDIQETIRELRSMAKELRPPSISNFGLEKAIRSYVEDFQEKHPNINLQLSLAQDRLLLPENVRITLFRVFQQAIANVLRHSRASEVRVHFTVDAEEVRLVVSDNGTGFDVPSSWMGFVRHGHYGLAGAAERVNALGGILLVESKPQVRTTITAVIPWTPGSTPSSLTN